MYCSNCGNLINDEMKFCSTCGHPVQINSAAVTLNCETPACGNRKGKRKFIITAIICAVAMIIAVLCIYFNSTTYLESQLTDGTWYEKQWINSYYLRGSTIDFYSNGKSKVVECSKYNGEWHSGSTKKMDWEILDGKTLYFKGDYYEWGDEWSLSWGTLKIGDRTYYSTDSYGYEEDLN